jgi:hypothetical protein
MIHRFRRLGVVALSIGCMCLVAACGSSSKSASSGAGPSGHFVGFKLTSDQRACLKKQGVTLPTGGFRGGRPGAGPNGGAPTGAGANGSGPNGKFTKRGRRKGKFPGSANGTPPAGFAKQMRKRQAAFKTCGISFPSRSGQGAPPAAG